MDKLLASRIRCIKFLQQSSLRQRSGNSGVTLLEQMIIIAVMGVLVVISVPNFSALLNRIKLDQSVAEAQSALVEAQQKAIRSNKSCDLILILNKDQISGSCLVTGKRTLSPEVAVATNLLPDISRTTEVALTQITNKNADSSRVAMVTDISPNLGISTGTGATKITLSPDRSHGKDSTNTAVVTHILSAAGGNCKNQGKGIKHCDDQNLPDNNDSSLGTIPIRFSALGTPKLTITTSITPPNTSVDPSGKIVV